MRPTPVLVCWLSVLWALQLSVSDAQLNGSSLANWTIGGVEVMVLEEDTPLNGTALLGRITLVGIIVEKRESEGLGFPDVLLSLDVENPGANADIFCLPYQPNNPNIQYPPTRSNNRWGSQHSQGVDYVFISSNSSFYGMSAEAEFSRETGIQQTVTFVCSLVGESIEPSEYRLELDLDYAKRSLVPDEESAARSVFAKCCIESGCPRWRELGSELLGTDPAGEFPVFDLCHVVPNVCDNDGHLIVLSMESYGLDCEFPLAEMGNFSRIQKIDISDNKLRGDIGEIAGVLKELTLLNRVRAHTNNFTGSLADRRLCLLVSGGLEFLLLGVNNLTGPLPDCLFDGNSTLTHIGLDLNNLASTLAPSFAEDSKIEFLSLGETGLTGSLPESMRNLGTLRILNLARNSLTGPVPADIGLSPFLEHVWMQQNRLTGAVPESLATNPNLARLDLSDNAFTEMPGVWNSPWNNDSFLLNVQLQSNAIRGPLPVALLTGPLVILDLSDNMFQGPLPALQNVLRFGWNVNMSSNQITGSIPAEWAGIGLITDAVSFDGINRGLDFSNNQMSGEIPRFLIEKGSLPSEAVNLEGNDFDCVRLFEDELIAHLRGIEVCGPDEGVGDDTESPSSLTTASSQEVQVAGQADSIDVVGVGAASSGEESSGTAGVVVMSVTIVIVGVVVLVFFAAIFVVIVRRRRSRAQHAVGEDGYDSTAVELGPAAKVKFQKYTDV